MKDMVQGALTVLQYDQYVGSAAAIVWAAALHYMSRGRSVTIQEWLWLAFKILGFSLMAGPGGAFIIMMLERDERLLQDGTQGTSSWMRSFPIFVGLFSQKSLASLKSEDS